MSSYVSISFALLNISVTLTHFNAEFAVPLSVFGVYIGANCYSRLHPLFPPSFSEVIPNVLEVFLVPVAVATFEFPVLSLLQRPLCTHGITELHLARHL